MENDTDRDRRAIHDLARAVAPLLPGGGVYDDPGQRDDDARPWHATIRGGIDGERLRLTYDTWRHTRILVAGIIPCALPSGERYDTGIACPTITVARDRSPEAVARDIVRRLLPVYAHRRHLALQRLEQVATADAKRRALAQKIHEIIGGRIRGDSRTSSDVQVLIRAGRGYPIDVVVDVRPDGAKFEIDVSGDESTPGADLAVAVAEAIAPLVHAANVALEAAIAEDDEEETDGASAGGAP